MEYLGVVLVAAVTLGLCWLVDKGFTKLFRSQAQHHSGLAVRLNKKYGAFGLILAVLGIVAIFTGARETVVLLVGGCIVALMGAALVVYYMTFGVFYDADSFLLTTFGKKSTAYQFKDIRCQQLYQSYGSVVVELQMTDGRTVHLQAAMPGVYPFLDHAFSAWCRQTGRDPENCPHHDPENHCWFPKAEDL